MKILIADDDPVSRRLLEAKLTKWGYEVIVTCNGKQAWQALQSEDSPRLAIIDWMMPGFDGVELCRKIRERTKEPYTYLILLTSLSREENIVTGMEAGADDYITKPFHTNELKVRLRAGRRIVDLQENLITAREALRAQATHDPLTGLWNHEEIIRILGVELARAQRQGTAITVVMADIDYFKRINDTYGHMAGDAVLRLTAKRMLSRARSYDTIGRYGGEEFLLVLPVRNDGGAFEIAEKFRLNIANGSMDTPEGLIPVTISLGVAVSGKAEQADCDTLIRAADEALYRAKHNGRNCTERAVLDAITTNHEHSEQR